MEIHRFPIRPHDCAGLDSMGTFLSRPSTSCPVGTQEYRQPPAHELVRDEEASSGLSVSLTATSTATTAAASALSQS